MKHTMPTNFIQQWLWVKCHWSISSLSNFVLYLYQEHCNSIFLLWYFSNGFILTPKNFVFSTFSSLRHDAINLAHWSEQILMVMVILADLKNAGMVISGIFPFTNYLNWYQSYSCWWTKHENPSIAIFRGIGGINLASFVPFKCNRHGWAGPREKVTQGCNWNCWIKIKSKVKVQVPMHNITTRGGGLSVTATSPQAVHSQSHLPSTGLFIMLTTCATKYSLPHDSWFCLENLKPKH